MKKDTSAPKRAITTLSIVPGTLVVCGCMLAAFAVIFALMASAGMITLPPVLAPLFGQGEDGGNDDGFSADFLAALSGVEPPKEADQRLLSMDGDALKELLLRCEPAESYYQCLDVTWTDGATVFNKSLVYYIVSGERFHAEMYPIGGIPKYLIGDGEQLWLRHGGDTRIFRRAEGSVLTPESECGIPSLTRVKEMIRASEEGKYALSLETVMDAPCIRVTFTDPLTGIREVFDVMPDRGLIVAASSCLADSEMPYYQMATTTILTDLTGLDESTFQIPTT